MKRVWRYVLLFLAVILAVAAISYAAGNTGPDKTAAKFVSMGWHRLPLQLKDARGR